MTGIVDKITKVYNMFEDDWSRNIFENRIKFAHVYNASNRGVTDGFDFYSTSSIPDIEKRFAKNDIFSIAGAGTAGQMLMKALTHAGYNVLCFIDNDKEKQTRKIMNIPVKSYEEICEETENKPIVVIANYQYGGSFYRQLKSYDYPEEKILFCLDGQLVSKFGIEYFDIPRHEFGKQEVFVDAGCLDGTDTLKFMEWSNFEYKKIVAIEPSVRSFKRIKKHLEYQNVTCLNIALGKENSESLFYDVFDHPGGSGLMKKESAAMYSVPVRKLDDVLQDESVSFIKMDIEGSEYEALLGAKKVISRYKPVLAISVYHNEDDIIEIPLLIKKLNDKYKFYLRHHSNTICDVILYCI